jgi:hypothetical protein
MRPLYLQQESSGSRWIGCWVKPKAGVDAVLVETNLVPLLNRTLDLLPVAHRCIDTATLTQFKRKCST